ncbi:MAG: hypothetical protein AB9846_12590 [Tenuifilaceae bacterium]
MRNYKYPIIIILSVCFSLSLFGQQRVVLDSKLQTPSEYFLQVKQFGEFMDRFNYKTDWKGQPISEEFKKRVPRANYIFSLINSEDSRLSNPSDSSYRKLCTEFIRFIDAVENPKYINLYSGQVTAWALVNITYLGKNQQVKVSLIPEVLSDRSAKWVISSIVGKGFETNADSSAKHFIAPNSHETSFINIKKLNSGVDPIYFFSEPTSSVIRFYSEISKKRIIVQNIEKVTYKISFPGWEISVDEFNRSSNNSGWLINDISRKLF